jgi:hypothetical protein
MPRAKQAKHNPDLCDKCHKRTSPYRVRVQIYALEDFPIRQYYFDLCEVCSKMIVRNSKRQKLKVHDLPTDNM